MTTVVKQLIESHIDELENGMFTNIVTMCPHDYLFELIDTLHDSDLAVPSTFQSYVYLVQCFANWYSGGRTVEIGFEDSTHIVTFMFKHVKFDYAELQNYLNSKFPDHYVKVRNIKTTYNHVIETYVTVSLQQVTLDIFKRGML